MEDKEDKEEEGGPITIYRGKIIRSNHGLTSPLWMRMGTSRRRRSKSSSAYS